jgi:hypothetical protein
MQISRQASGEPKLLSYSNAGNKPLWGTFIRLYSRTGIWLAG